MDEVVRNVVLRWKQKLAKELSFQRSGTYEETLLIKREDLQTCIDGLSGHQSRECANAFLLNGGLDIINRAMVQRSLAANCLKILQLLCDSQTQSAQFVLSTAEWIVSRSVMLCQRSNLSEIHEAFVALMCSLANSPSICRANGTASWTVPDAILRLTNTKSKVCKTTAIKCLAAISLDSACCRNLFLGSCASQPVVLGPNFHWTSALLPQLFRIFADRTCMERQFAAAEALVLLCPLNSKDVSRVLAIFFALDVFAEGCNFLYHSLTNFAVKDSRSAGASVATGSPVDTRKNRWFHEHATVASYLVSRLVESVTGFVQSKTHEDDCERGRAVLDVLRASKTHMTMLLFVLAVFQTTGGLQAEDEELLREAREAQTRVGAALQSWIDADDELCFEFYEMLAHHKLPISEAPEGGIQLLETVRSPEFTSSLAMNALIAKIRIEFPLVDHLNWFSKHLQKASEQDARGFVPLLRRGEGSMFPTAASKSLNEDLNRAREINLQMQTHPHHCVSRAVPHSQLSNSKNSSKSVKAAQPKLGYKMLADLFTLDENATWATEAKLKEALKRLPSHVTSGKAPPKAEKKAERDRPWHIKKRLVSWTERQENASKAHRQNQRASSNIHTKAIAADSVTADESSSCEPVLLLPEPPKNENKLSARRPSPRTGGAFLRFLAAPPSAEQFSPPKKFAFGGISIASMELLAEQEGLFLTQQQN